MKKSVKLPKDYKLPEPYKAYKVFIYTKNEGVGPFNVISRNTVNSTTDVLRGAATTFPDIKDDIMSGELMWMEDSNPPVDLLEDFKENWEEIVANGGGAMMNGKTI